jgi:hypothetical protein
LETRSVFDRYNIIDNRDLKDAVRKLQESEKVRAKQLDKSQFGHNASQNATSRRKDAASPAIN